MCNAAAAVAVRAGACAHRRFIARSTHTKDSGT
ncbi:hypothetical protein DM49_2327 [Burkholderia mallei]|nr:hypothetical protein DM46_826 [Burkholderia mallei]KOS78871.1 hypothetical protein DM53_2755 [Burkholderia mallei]KOS94732.1 hypothetical protein DM49_2327 [Burkholderia mallei]KOT20075.1 hypothetical protein DM52_844 [Burkholderia mallei]